MSDAANIHKLLDETVRRERGWLISSLVSKLGPANVDLAEDVADDAIVKALATWPFKGNRDNPHAWLRRVAGNAAIDRVRQSAREFGVDDDWDFGTSNVDIITPSLSDPELDLMVLCCDPASAPQNLLLLALKTVCGFTATETTALFFMTEDALSQRLARAKRTLKAQSGELARYPTRFALHERLPRRGGDLFREDICREDIRLSEGLLAQTDGEAAAHHVLHALLLFQRARLPARAGSDGHLLTLEPQDRSLWNRTMIFDAAQQLDAAQSSSDLTCYHLEAGIASIHARANTWAQPNWAAIARFYEVLDTHAPSLAVTVNWAVGLMLIGALEDAETRLDAAATVPGAAGFTGYHLARAKLATLKGDSHSAQAALEASKNCQTSAPVETHFEREIGLVDYASNRPSSIIAS